VAAADGRRPLARRIAAEAGFALAALVAAAPLLASPLPPGGDTPWHAALVAILAADDPARFLGGFVADAGWGSYVAVYRVLALLAGWLGAAGAVQVLVVGYALGTLYAARALIVRLGGDRWLALLAAPAVYSTTLEFGFVAFLPAIPLLLASWAAALGVVDGGPRPHRLAALGAAWLGVALCHPFAAAIGVVGAAVCVLPEVSRTPRRRLGAIAAVLAIGAIPAGLGVLATGGAGEAQVIRWGDASLWEKATTQVFTPPLQALADAPRHLIGWAPALGAWIAAAALAIALLVDRLSAGRGWANPDGRPWRSNTARLLALALLALYLVTPFTFEWPRNWYGAQPRLVPLLWVAVIAAIGRPGAARWARGLALATTAGVLALQLVRLGPAVLDARDLAAVIDAGAPRARTLPLIEQPPAISGWPPSSMRHAGAWMVAAHGGDTAFLPFAGDPRHAGAHLPVRRAPDAPPRLPAPMPGRPRDFAWDVHGGWDQLLIRDADPDARHDYLGAHATDVVEVARVGRWRLYRRAGGGGG
jgi:hypothetical protein